MVQLVIDKGADISTADSEGIHHWASRNGHKAIVELLVGNNSSLSTARLDEIALSTATPRSGQKTFCNSLRRKCASTGPIGVNTTKPISPPLPPLHTVREPHLHIQSSGGTLASSHNVLTHMPQLLTPVRSFRLDSLI